jgi:general secretion pathway protein G
MRRRTTSRDARRVLGFTLVEMLVVMMLIGLLLSIAAPRYLSSVDHAKDVALEENIKVVRVTLDRFYADKGRYPDNLEELVQQKYLRAVPADPVTESSSTWVEVPSSDPEIKGIVDVKSGAPGATKSGRRYDAF